MKRHHEDDPEMLSRQPADLGPLFQSWPERPPVREVEQSTMPLEGTTAGRYAAWRRSEEGELVFRCWCAEALRKLSLVPLDERRRGCLGSKHITEDVRRALRRSINNSFTGHLAREAAERSPALRGMFELRERKAV